MTLLLSQSAADFAARFASLVDGRRDEEADVRATVAEIVAAIRLSGDTALLELTERYDRLSLLPQDLRFSAAQIEAASPWIARRPVVSVAV